jgi:hypothetical protein
MSGNVPVNGSYPAVEFQPLESNSVAHTDQEVTDSSDLSRMYRTYNAQYNGTEWKTLTTGTSAAYATVQNPDGSIHYYTNPDRASTWTSWAGSANNAVYNAVDYGLVEGAGQSQATRAANVAAIQAAITAAIAKVVPGKSNGGGTVVIPAGIYELGGTTDPVAAATITISGVTGGLTIRGESAGTTLWQYGTPPSSGTGENNAADIFDISDSGNPGQVGMKLPGFRGHFPLCGEGSTNGQETSSCLPLGVPV